MAQPYRMLVSITSRLSVAVEFVFLHMFSKAGVICPCCGGFVRVKPYVVGRKLARGLQVLYDAHGAEVHIDDFAGNSRMHGILCHAGLIEQLTHDPNKPFNRSGMWAITQRGVDWIEGRVTIPQKINVLYKTFVGGSIEQITFEEARGNRRGPMEVTAAATDPTELQ